MTASVAPDGSARVTLPWKPILRGTSDCGSVKLSDFRNVAPEMGQGGMSNVYCFLMTGTVRVHGAPHAAQVALKGTIASTTASVHRGLER